ncbi:MAG: TetR/AcrR family transcriptional regulator [Planctomycetota bacterium]
MPGPAKQFDPDEALDSAMRVFWARGYESAPVSELMKAMSLSKKSLYDTFGNKRTLFIKSLRRYAQVMGAEISLALNKDVSPMKNLKYLLRSWQKQATQRGSVGCMIGTNVADFDLSDPEVAGILRSMLEHVEQAFHRCLKAAVEAGELDASVKTRDVARTLVAVSQGMALLGRVQESETFLNSAEAGVMSLLQSRNSLEAV